MAPTMEVFADSDNSPNEILLKVELVMLSYLNWRTLVPTPTEIVKRLLFFTNHENDFADIIQKANDHIMLMSLVYETCGYAYSTIGLTALLVVLEELNFNNFALGIKNLIIEFGLAFDLDDVAECKTKIQAYLSNEEQSQ